MNKFVLMLFANCSQHSNCFAIYLECQFFFCFCFINCSISSTIDTISGFNVLKKFLTSSKLIE